MVRGDVRETHLYRSAAQVVGEFVWQPPGDRGARRGQRVGDAHLAVIPWKAVRIAQEGAEAFVADPATVVFYNPLQAYSAEQLLAAGEHSAYFAVDPRGVRDVARAFDPAIDDRPRRALRFTHGPCDAASFARHRRIVEYARKREDVDPILLEESIARLVMDLVSDAYAARGTRARRIPPNARVDRRRRECADAARQTLLRQFRQRVTLLELADYVGVSVYHLCRIFRAHVGVSIHQYLTDLRLRASLDALCEGRRPLALLALDLGFSNQAHFTTAFSRRFGCTPDAFRRDTRDGRTPSPASTILEDRPRRSL